MKKKDGSKWFYYVFVILLYFLVFQNALQPYIKVLKYFDEILAILTLPILIIKMATTKQWKMKKYDLCIVVNLIFILLIGLYANIKYQYQPLSIVLSDVLLFFKFFLVYYLFTMLNCKQILESYSSGIIKHLRFISGILMLFTICNYIFKIYPSNTRFGIMENKLFYSHQTYLTAVCVFLLTLMIYFQNKVNNIYIYMVMFVMFTTLRMKAIGFLVAFLFIAIYVTKFNKKVTFSKLGIIALVCIAVVYQQIEYYFIKIEDSARSVLLNTSIEIAKDYAPIGTGFGTFASYFSGENYSPVYAMYNIQNIYGLVKGKASFISDSFWPMVLGQFGYSGVILYIVCIFLIFRKIQLQYSADTKYEYIAKISALIYLMISSTSEAAFVHPIAIALAVVIGM